MFTYLDAGWYELRKGYQGSAFWDGAPFDVWINNYGCRTDQFTKTTGKADIVFLGDSFTFGSQGPWKDNFVAMFEAYSSKKVINAGVPSYSPTPYLYRYKQLLEGGQLANQHSLVIGVDVSDVQDEASFWMDGISHPTRRYSGLAREPSNLLATRLKLTLGLLELINRGLLNRLRPPPSVTNSRRSAFTWEVWKNLDDTPAWENGGYAPIGVAGGLARISSKLTDIVTIAHSYGAKVFFVTYPWPAQLAKPTVFDWPHFISSVCETAKCDGVIDSTPAFRSYANAHTSWYTDLYINGDIHFSRRGNEIVFDNLKQGLP